LRHCGVLVPFNFDNWSPWDKQVPAGHQQQQRAAAVLVAPRFRLQNVAEAVCLLAQRSTCTVLLVLALLRFALKLPCS
jgi:hypothetical protein